MSADAPQLVLEWKAAEAPDRLAEREWLVTNGLGGFASGTLLGIPTRRYHGLFVPNLAQPKGRYIMLSRLDEQIVSGGTHVQLGGAELIDGTLHTQSHLYLKAFSLQHPMPTWSFEIDGQLL